MLVSITASPDIGLDEVDEASTMITEQSHPDANIIWGAAFDPELEDEMRVTIIATGFDSNVQKMEVPKATTTEAAPTVSVEPEQPKLSDTDFDDIISILNKTRRN